MIGRRTFIAVLGSAAAWPLGARAQQAKMPVIGFLDFGVPEVGLSSPASGNVAPYNVAAFRKGLSEAGYVEGRNVVIEFRFAQNEINRLPELVADLVRRGVAVIVAWSGTPTAVAAKAATTNIPIVFQTGDDPVQAGLVAGLNRPGGNVTGVTSMNVEIYRKRLEFLHELLPRAHRFAMLMYPELDSKLDESVISNLQAAGTAIGREIEVLMAATNREIDNAFASLVQRHCDALLVGSYALFANRKVQIATLAARYMVPAIAHFRGFCDVGGLMSYGASYDDMARLGGIYAGRILKGDKPADLPVVQPTKFEFVINMQTARLLGIEVPTTLLALADEVIE
jgi:putative ABC transport system substrate-binding protein